MRVTQRSVMIDLFQKLGGDYETVISAYVAAEEQGLAPRLRKTIEPERYARRLWSDGMAKGWLNPSHEG